MKRKFILLPITLTALAPAISLVGCGDPDTPEPTPPEPEYIEVNEWYEGQYSYHLMTKKWVSVIPNKKYCFKIDMSKWEQRDLLKFGAFSLCFSDWDDPFTDFEVYLKDNWHVYIDDEECDNCELFFQKYIAFDENDKQKIINARFIRCELEVSQTTATPTDLIPFELYSGKIG